MPLFIKAMTFKDKVSRSLEEALLEKPSLFLIDVSISESFKITVTLDGDSGVILQDCIDISRSIENNLDREECDFSTTLNLGGDKWPIYLDPDSSSGISNDNKYIKGNNKGVEINLSQGDMLIYRGSKFEHWREPFDKTYCSQVFLHYNNYTDKSNIFDKRIHLGLPSYMRGLKIT